MDKPLNETSFREVADKGDALYQTVRNKYEPHDNGKFLAVDVDQEKFYLGVTSKEAVDQARAANPGKMFYIVKIGFDSMETLALSLVGRT